MSLAFETPAAGMASAAGGCGSPIRSPRSAAPDAWHHFARLEHALTVALGPLDYPDSAAWVDALGDALLALANGSTGAVLLPEPVPQWHTIGTSIRADGLGPLRHDEATELLGVPDFIGSGDAILWVRDDLAATTIGTVTPASTPARHALGIRIRTASGAVAAVYVRCPSAHGALDRQVIAAFRAIGPAFQAGVNSWMCATTSRANVEGMLDSLSDAAFLFDVGGTPVHANAASVHLGSQTATRLRDEAQRVAWSLGAVLRRRGSAASSSASAAAADPRASRSVRLGSLVYRLRGSIVGEHLIGTHPAILVTVTTASTEPLSDDALETEYGLTAREIQVARLLAEGLSNNEIAERIGVRFFTARNHVERTLAKLGVASRHRVGPLLRNEAPEAMEVTDSGRAA